MVKTEEVQNHGKLEENTLVLLTWQLEKPAPSGYSAKHIHSASLYGEELNPTFVLKQRNHKHMHLHWDNFVPCIYICAFAKIKSTFNIFPNTPFDHFFLQVGCEAEL